MPRPALAAAFAAALALSSLGSARAQGAPELDAQAYAGSFRADPTLPQNAGQRPELHLSYEGDGHLGGYLDAEGLQLNVEGRVHPDGVLRGEVVSGRSSVAFSASLDGHRLRLELQRGGRARRVFLLDRVGAEEEDADLVGTFYAGSVRLILEEDPDDPQALSGELQVGDGSYPVAARRQDAVDDVLTARGTYRTQRATYGFLATLEDPEELILRADNGNVFRLRRFHGLHRRAPGFRHPEGMYGLDLPPGWTVEGHSPGLTALNPGLEEGQVVVAQARIHHGYERLSEGRLTPSQLLERHAEGLAPALAAQGIELVSREDPRPLEHEAVEAALLEARGVIPPPPGSPAPVRGEPVRVLWLVARADGSTVSLIVTALEERADEFLPPARLAFQSLVIYPRLRDRGLEDDLAGRVFGHTDESADPPTRREYAFRSGARVTRRVLPAGGGAPLGEEEGRYEVVDGRVLLVFEERIEVPTLVLEEGLPLGLDFDQVEFR